MITCLVCGKQYETGDCPRCQFPDVQIPGSREKAIQNLKPAIDSYRANFLTTVRVEVLSYYWKDNGGTLVLDREERRLLGTASELMKGEKWLDQAFARIPEAKLLPVRVAIVCGEESRLLTIPVPNLTGAELQKIGAVMDENCNLRLLLGSDTQTPTRSDPVAIFD